MVLFAALLCFYVPPLTIPFFYLEAYKDTPETKGREEIHHCYSCLDVGNKEMFSYRKRKENMRYESRGMLMCYFNVHLNVLSCIACVPKRWIYLHLKLEIWNREMQMLCKA